MTDLERMIYNQFKKHGNEKCFVDDFVSMFPGRSKYEIQRALDNLVRTNMLYSVDTYVGKIYGIDDYEYGGQTVTINMNTGDGIEDVLNFFDNGNSLKAKFVSNFDRHASKISPIVKNINDPSFLRMKLTETTFKEWMVHFSTNMEYLNRMRDKVVTTVVENIMEEFGGYPSGALNVAFKRFVTPELIEIAKWRTANYKDAVEFANSIFKNNENNSLNIILYKFLLDLFKASVVESVLIDDLEISVPITGIDDLKESLVNPNSVMSPTNKDGKSVNKRNKQ